MKFKTWLVQERNLWASALPRLSAYQKAVLWSVLVASSMLPSVAFAQVGVDKMFANFSSSSIAIFNLVMKLGVLLGILITGKAVLSLKEYSESGGRTQLKTPVTLLVVGIMLFSLPTTMNTATQTLALGGFAGTNIMSERVPDVGVPGAAAAIRGVLLFVKLVGIIAAVRGFLILKEVAAPGGGGRAGMGSALTFILGGAAAVNIEMTYTFLKNSVGWS